MDNKKETRTILPPQSNFFDEDILFCEDWQSKQEALHIMEKDYNEKEALKNIEENLYL